MARGERSKMLEKGRGAGEKCGGSAVKILNTIKQMEISLKRHGKSSSRGSGRRK